MAGMLVTEVLGKVSSVKDGKAKTGKAWFRATLSLSIYNYGTKKYDQRMVNVAGFDTVAEAMKKNIKPGLMLWARGDAKPGQPFKTNDGNEIVPLDLVARDWTVAGTAIEREVQQAPDAGGGDDDADPFAG